MFGLHVNFQLSGQLLYFLIGNLLLIKYDNISRSLGEKINNLFDSLFLKPACYSLIATY